MIACLLAIVAGGCGLVPVEGDSGGHLSIRPASGAGESVSGGFNTGLYRYENASELTALLVDGPLEAPRRIAVIRMHWMPQAGLTPIAPTATNATVHYVIFTPDGLGLYGGAGYLHPDNAPGQATLSAGLWQAHMKLKDATATFEDDLGRAIMEGELTARRDDVRTREALQRMHHLIHQRLGHPRMVRAKPAIVDF